MTTKQAQVFEFIIQWQREHKSTPSLHDIASFCLHSPYAHAAFKHVNALVDKGYLEKAPNGTIKFWKPLSLPCLEMGVRV